MVGWCGVTWVGVVVVVGLMVVVLVGVVAGVMLVGDCGKSGNGGRCNYHY